MLIYAKACNTIVFLEPEVPVGMYCGHRAVPVSMFSFLKGEDDVSFARHVKALQVEFKKQHRNPQVVGELMSTTFALRRKDILAHTYDLKAVLDKYPFLGCVDHVC